MKHLKSVVSYFATTAALCVVTISSAFGAHFEKLTCSPIQNTRQRYYDTQVLCTATVARPGSATWYSAAGQYCPTFCASIGGVNTPSPDGFSCVSGEVRGWSAIGVVNFAPTGCWHDCRFPEGRTGSVRVGYRCYSPGQKRDNDRTDITVGCYCATGEVSTSPIEVGIYAWGDASASGRANYLFNWESVLRNVRNDRPWRIFDVVGTVPLGETSTINMAVNVKGACGTSVLMTGTIAQSTPCDPHSSDVLIPLPACASGCSDGIDNDGDGLIDYPADPGCTNPQDDDESNPILPRVTPIAECVDVNQDGTLVAHFGYQNDASSVVDVAVGAQNYFSPGATNRGQPTTFLTGRLSNVFTVPLGSTETVSWIVGDSITSASIATERCQSSEINCVDTDNSDTLTALDGTARDQRNNIQRLTRKVLRLQSTGTAANKAESYSEQAQSLYLQQWSEIWGAFPKISTNCTSCASVDKSADITDLDTRSRRMYRLARQTALLLRAVRRGRLRPDEQALVSDASSLYDQFIERSQSLPRFESQCN